VGFGDLDLLEDEFQIGLGCLDSHFVVLPLM